MKLMFFYSSMLAGGAERMISALANYYAQHNIDITVAVMDHRPSFYQLDPRIQFMNLYRLNKSKNRLQALRNGLKIIRITRRAFKEIEPECVVCFGTNYLLYAVIARFFLNIKIIGSERNNPNRNHYNFWDRVRKFVALFADGFIFQTNGAKNYYPKTVQANSVIVPNGVFIDKSADLVGYNDRIPNSICAVGRLHYQKGYDILLEAFSMFSQHHPAYTLKIFGEGNERERLQDLITTLGLEGKVILAGRITNVIETLSQMQIYILSSRFEGMPNALMEGMAVGCACISTDCDFGPRELIRDGENGLMVPAEQPALLARAMEKLAADPVLCEKLSRNAVNIRTTHSIENIAEKYLSYIAQIVG